ncbi:MAG: hypothetical protein ACYDG5_07510, partial [Dehalococcoidales bacterium]
MVIISLLLNLIAINSAPTLAANPEALKWTRVNIPTEGTAGGWVLASGSDVQHLTAAADGTLYAYYVKGSIHALFKSTDGGLRWAYTSDVSGAITSIAISPKDTKIVYYTTASSVYRSSDAGKSFSQLPALPVGAAHITSIAVTWLNVNIIAVGMANAASSNFGGVYMIEEGDFISSWTDTSIGNYDVYALGFSPNYPVDRQIVAVATNETDTFINSKIGNANWNAFAEPSKLNKDNSVLPAGIAAVEAIIRFPGSYHTGPASGDSFFVGINTGTGEGDVYRIDYPDISDYIAVTDLNCGSAYGLIDTDITGLTVYGDEQHVILLAGAAFNCRTFISQDGGRSWIKSKKEPTGASHTEVLMAPNFAEIGMIYAATNGSNSALSVSRDIGLSWNQISLIDTVVNNIESFTPSPQASQSNTMFMITSGMGQSLWRSTDDGFNWERILASNSPGVDNVGLIGLPPQYGTDSLTLFVYGESYGHPTIWESQDNGQSFQRRFTCDPATGVAFPIDVWAIFNENTFFTASFYGSQGMILRTTDAGNSYSSGVPAGVFRVHSLVLSPNFENDGTILAGNDNGWVYHSSNNGSSFQSLPAGT